MKYLQKLLLCISIATAINFTAQSQQGFSKKIVILKVYNDSLQKKESDCLFASIEKIDKSRNVISIQQFKNTGSYVIENNMLKDHTVRFFGKTFTFDKVPRSLRKEFIYKIAIYPNPNRCNDRLGFNFYKGFYQKDLNFDNACFKVVISFPSFSYSSELNRYLSSDRDVDAGILNNNLDYFFDRNP